MFYFIKLNNNKSPKISPFVLSSNYKTRNGKNKFNIKNNNLPDHPFKNIHNKHFKTIVKQTII